MNKSVNSELDNITSSEEMLIDLYNRMEVPNSKYLISL